MKNLSRIIVMLLSIGLVVSCSKEDTAQEEPEKPFDIHNPEGYYLYLKQYNAGFPQKCIVLEFMPGQSMQKYTLENSVLSKTNVSYTLVNDNTVGIAYDRLQNTPFPVPTLVTFEIKDGKVVGNNQDTQFVEALLVKKPASNPFLGKTFTGKYYSKDNSILHSNFFYSFGATGTSISAGFTAPNSTRTGNYELIGNFMAYSSLANGDKEFVIKIDNTLRTQYFDAVTVKYYYGEFTQQ